MSEEASVDFEALNKKDKRVFARLDRVFRPALTAVLSNPDGIDRLLAISDEEWQAAVDAEAPDAA